MGSKNLKAVFSRGTVGVQVKDPMGFMQATGAAKKILAENPVTGEGLPTYGTQVLMNVINELGALPSHNASDVQFDGAANIGGEAMVAPRETDGKANLVSNAACFGCPISCQRRSQMDPNHFTVKDREKYHMVSGGLEYEAAWALGAATGVGDLETLTFCNFICNEYGMDPITLGSTVAAAMELYKIGAITDKETGGVSLTFDSPQDLAKICEMTGKGEGFGKEIAMGSKRLCDGQGPGIPGLRSARHPGHGPDLRHLESRRLPSAQLYRGFRGSGHSGKDRSACHRGQGGPGQGVPGRDRAGRCVGNLYLHDLRAFHGRHRAADRRRLRGRLVGGPLHGSRRAHLEHGAGV
jgi:hypothetical protein